LCRGRKTAHWHFAAWRKIKCFVSLADFRDFGLSLVQYLWGRPTRSLTKGKVKFLPSEFHLAVIFHFVWKIGYLAIVHKQPNRIEVEVDDEIHHLQQVSSGESGAVAAF